MNQAVFLDRDGVINRVILRDGHPYSPLRCEDMEFLPGVGDAMDKLHRAGFRLVVVTNQPDVAKGLLGRDTVEAMHDLLRRSFPIDDIRACYHQDEDDCPCRKPKPGMLLEAARRWSVDLKRSFMVGDRWRDIAAGRAAGCRTIRVGSGYGEAEVGRPDAVASSLAEASRLILSWGLHLTRERAGEP